MHIWGMAIGAIKVREVNWWVWMVCEAQLGFFAGFSFPSVCAYVCTRKVSCRSPIPEFPKRNLA